VEVCEVGPKVRSFNLVCGTAFLQQSILLVRAVVAYSNLILAIRHTGFSNADTLTPTLQSKYTACTLINVQRSTCSGEEYPLVVEGALDEPVYPTVGSSDLRCNLNVIPVISDTQGYVCQNRCFRTRMLWYS